jgi:iron complex transport system substrate-binding protein
MKEIWMPILKVKNRRKGYIGFFLCLILSASLTLPCFATTIIDSTHSKVTIESPPKRIVTLIPSLGELVADLLDKDLDRLVGVSEYSDFPPGLKKVSSVGPYSHVNLEKIVSLKPDLVLATEDGNSKDQVVHLRDLGLKVAVIKSETVADIAVSIDLVAKALHKNANGARMAVALERGLAKIKDRVKGKPKLKVLLQLNDSPLVVAGKGSFLNEGLEWVGAENSYGDSRVHYPRPSIEDILNRNPDVIILMDMGKNIQTARKNAQQWYIHKNLKAVKNNRIYILNSEALLRPTLRFLEGLSQLSDLLYGKK